MSFLFRTIARHVVGDNLVGGLGVCISDRLAKCSLCVMWLQSMELSAFISFSFIAPVVVVELRRGVTPLQVGGLKHGVESISFTSPKP